MMSSHQPGRSLVIRSAHAAAAVVLGFAALTGCSADQESAQDRYCAAGESLQASLNSLTELNLIAEGTDGLTAAVEQVRTDLAELRDTAGTAAADDVAVLEGSVDALRDAISSLGDEITSENVATLSTAIGDVRQSARAVLDTLADC